MLDVEQVVHDCIASFVSAAFARDPRQPTKLLVALVIGYEYDDQRDLSGAQAAAKLACDEMLPEKDAPLWDESGIPGHSFFRLYAPTPGSIDTDPGTLHPWVDHIFDRNAAFEMFREHQDGGTSILSLGTSALIFIRRPDETAPLFVCPPTSDLLWGLGVFPSIPPHMADELLPEIRSYARRGQELGGKRYLSGYLDFGTASDWREHYGDAWELFHAAKRRFDPAGILNPGCIRWCDSP
jgi:FAD/FMN-containing dehydrogenase